jgi:uncharacterized protein with beta-barrel porin domain
MKAKYRQFLKAAFPSVIILPALAQMTSAAVINPDGFGNVLVTTTDSGAHNIQTGYSPVSGAHEIRVDANATLNPATGDVIEIQVVDASGATYTINNNGTLRALGGHPGEHGIDTIDLANAKPGITVNNHGLISGFSAIRANNTLVLNNYGTLTGIGYADGAVFAKNGATITNYDGASITGNAHGIQSELVSGILTIHNDAAITGTNFDGITSPGIVRLTNSYQPSAGGASTVTGKVNGVVGLGSGSTIANSGTLTGTTGDGVRVGHNATITNHTVVSDAPIFGGHISGGVNGVVAGGGLVLTNNEMGLIAGGTGDGIVADDEATLTNHLGAAITGGDDALNVGDEATLTNHGTITGTHADGIHAGNNAILTNTGSITGGNDGIEVAGAATASRLTNTGTITGVAHSFLGDSGADTLYLNLGSRLVGDVATMGGVDSIHFDGGLTSPSSLGNSISGNISGMETIHKGGDGVALIGLPGELFSVRADTININSGGLYLNANIDGNSLAHSSISASGATLGGTGTWDANLLITAGGFSAGAIPITLDANPHNAVGLLTLTGDVDHAAGSFIRCDVNPNTPILNGIDSDLIRQTGAGNTYDIAGANLRLATTDNDQVIRNGGYTVVNSDEAITGLLDNVTVQFNPNVIADDYGFVGSEVDFYAAAAYDNDHTVLANYFTIASKSFDQTDLVLTVEHDFAGLPGLSANASNLGGALDASITSPDPLTQDFIAALDYSDLLTVQDTLNSLIPDAVLGAASALVSSNYRVHRLVQDHLAMSRSGESPSITTPATTDAKGGVIPAQTSASSGAKSNVWGTASYDWKDSNFGTSDFDGDDLSFTAGFDYRVAPEWLVGILIDGSQGDYDYTGGSSDVESLRLALYATYGQATGLYADCLLGYGDHDLDVDRTLGGILSGTSNSSTNASSIQAMLTVGYAMMSDNIKHGPFAGLEYQNIDVDDYTQTGDFPIGVSGCDIDSLRALIGYRAEARYGQFTPYASLAYAHEFEDGPINTTAVIPGGTSFAVSGGGIESAILISLGTGYAFTANLGLNIGYHGEISVGGDGIDSHGATIGLNYGF